MVHLDINHDGLDELIVTTMYGVHILQVKVIPFYKSLLSDDD